MKRKLYAIMAYVLAAAMLISMPGCGGKKDNGDNSKSKSGSSKAKAKPDMSLVDTSGDHLKMKDKTKLTMLIPKDTNIEDLDTNDYITKLEDAVNVDLQFEYLPASDAKQKLSVMLSSGTELPDTILYNLSSIEVYTYGAQGYFLPLNDYIDQCSKYFKDYLGTDEGKENTKYFKSPDGNIYSYPNIIEEIGNDYDHRIWINKTWLDKLGLEKPTTTDEYYQVLKAFKEKDPNGNGKADEIPLVGSTDGWVQGVWKTLMYSFLYLNDYFDYIVKDKDGKLTVSYIQPEFRDGLEYLNKLCSEGLLSPLTFTQDQNQLKQIIGDPSGVVIGSVCAGSMSLYAASEERKKDITHLAPLIGPDGVQLTSDRHSSLPNYVGYITKDCKNPTAAAVLFDYMYSTDMAMQGRWGTEGKSWVKAEPGEKGMYEDQGYDPIFKITDNIWGTTQNQEIGEVGPTLRQYDLTCGQVTPDDPYNAQLMSAEASKEYMDKVPDDVVYRIIYTKEEADEIAEILNSLNTYRDEAVVAFITGTRPLSDWDNYVKEIQNIGLDKFVEISQKAYDRMQKQ